MQEEAFQRAAEIRRLLEFGLAPRDLKLVIEQHVAGTVDDDMRLAPAVRAPELVQAVDLGIAVTDFIGKGVVAEIRATGVTK